MRMRALIAVIAGLFAGERVQLMGGTSARTAQGWVATPKLHIKGQGSVKNIRPELYNRLWLLPFPDKGCLRDKR